LKFVNAMDLNKEVAQGSDSISEIAFDSEVEVSLKLAF